MKYISFALVFLSISAHAVPVDALKELMIVDARVVEDARSMPGGPWHFGTLIREMLPTEATDKEVSDFVVSWLEEWGSVTTLNGFVVTPRASVRNAIICPWLNASTGLTTCQGTLDMKKAPFRLLAITNRIDIRKPDIAGEGRFTFALLDDPTENPNDPAMFAREFTVLLNYALPLTKGKDIQAWAKQWHGLSEMNCDGTDCEGYRTALAKITDQFARRGLMTGKPNGNPFIELHTNEFVLGSPWELRQFVLKQTARGLKMTHDTTNKTPDKTMNDNAELVQWAKDNEAAILNETHSVPKRFLGGMSHQSFGDEHKWHLTGVSEDVRFSFSKNTCNGCHREEGDKVPSVDGFYHVSPLRPAGTDRLSPWLLDTELPRRAKIVEELLNPPTPKRKNPAPTTPKRDLALNS